MALILFLYIFLFLLFALTALVYTFQATQRVAVGGVDLNENCNRTFIRESWIFNSFPGSLDRDGCGAVGGVITNDYLVRSNRLFRREIVSNGLGTEEGGKGCCAFSSSSTIPIEEPRVLVGDTLRIFGTDELNQKPYIVNYNARTYTPTCFPCAPISSIVLSKRDNNSPGTYYAQNDINLVVEVDLSTFRAVRVTNTTLALPIIEADLFNGQLQQATSYITPTTEKIITISNRAGIAFQPLPLPSLE